MADNKIYKCRYSKCFYSTRDIMPEDDCLINKTHYHQKCYEYKTKISAIADFYYNNVSKTVVYSQLVNTINNIVYKKIVSPDYLLFALKYAVKNGFKIKSPFYLHYLIDRDDVKRAYENEREIHTPRIKPENISVEEEQVFTYKPKTKNSFRKIID